MLKIIRVDDADSAILLPLTKFLPCDRFVGFNSLTLFSTGTFGYHKKKVKSIHRNIVLSLIGVILLALLIGKLNEKNESQWRRIKTKSLIELFEYAYKNRNSEYIDSITSMIIDSIQVDPSIVISTIEVVDSILKKVKLDFYNNDLFWDNYEIRKRNVLTVYINEFDSSFVNDKTVISQDSLSFLIKDYIINPIDKPFLPEKRIINVDYFRDFPVANAFFFLKAKMIPDSLGLSTSWHHLFENIDIIVESNNQLRNELSLSRFRKQFMELELDKQEAISEVLPLRIYIFLDYKYEIPPQPLMIDLDIILNLTYSLDIDMN